MEVIFPSRLRRDRFFKFGQQDKTQSYIYLFCFTATQAAVHCFCSSSSLSLVKTPSLIVIKLALVSCFFLLSLLPICVVRLALSHSVPVSSLTVTLSLWGIDLCLEPRFSGRSLEGGGRLLLGGTSFLLLPRYIATMATVQDCQATLTFCRVHLNPTLIHIGSGYRSD